MSTLSQLRHQHVMQYILEVNRGRRISLAILLRELSAICRGLRQEFLSKGCALASGRYVTFPPLLLALMAGFA